MLLLMDESGDKGPDVRKGSSRWLVVAGVLFPSAEVADECQTALIELRRTVGKREYHFRLDPDSRRVAVFECLARFPFIYHAVACDKTRIDQKRWRHGTALFHEVAGRVIDLFAAALIDCKLRFDTVNGRDQNRSLGKHLVRRAGKVAGKSRIIDPQPVDSGKDVLAQTADYVCGAVGRSFREAGPAADQFRRLIRHREGIVRLWPEVSGNEVGGPTDRPAPPSGDTRSSAEKPSSGMTL